MKISIYHLTGGCMRPLLNEGDTVLVAVTFKPTQIVPGDLVLYTISGRTFLHRIWLIKKLHSSVNYRLLVKDDTAYVTPHWIDIARVIGKPNFIQLVRVPNFTSRQYIHRLRYRISKFVSQGSIGLVYSILMNGIFWYSRRIKRVFGRGSKF